MADKQTLLTELAEILQKDRSEVTPNLRLEDAGWDSVAVMSVIAMMDEQCGVTLSGAQLMECQTVGDIINLAGPQSE